VEVADRPGRAWASSWEVFEGGDVNIEYMYAFTFSGGDRAALIFRFDRPDAAIERLRAAGPQRPGDVEAYHRIAP